MAFDIFSSFDDHNKISTILSTSYMFMWVSLFTAAKSKFWTMSSTQSSTTFLWMAMMLNIVSRTQASKMGMAYLSFASWTMIIMWTNIMGLMPYVFSLTSHLSMNLSMAFPMWLSMILLSLTYDMNKYLSHFQPLGSPTILNPFLCSIELISNLVRPITLSVRLAANLSTGHIMLTLLGSAYTSSNLMLMMIILTMGMLYIMFEGAVCVIQTYIFTLLPAMFSDDHPSYCDH